jgi:hypothetical protein
MPTDELRRDEIAAAVAAYAAAHPEARLPRRAAELLAIMFGSDDVCRRSLDDLASEGFDRHSLPGVLRRLIEFGFLSKELGSGRASNTYRLHLPARDQP